MSNKRLREAAPTHGFVAPGFEGVRRAFDWNLAHASELGAAFAVYHQGEKVVDLWGGYVDKKRTRLWEEDTVTTVFSTTKGIASCAMALAHSRGLFEWDAPMAEYWPDFAQQDKGRITVRQVFAHQAGLAAIDAPLDPAILGDLPRLGEAVAAQKPRWEPGAHHGYHAISLGWYQGELLRRVDPEGRSLGRFFREELAEPLGLDIQIGLPAEFPIRRLSPIFPGNPLAALFRAGGRHTISRRMIFAMLNRKSITAGAFFNPRLKGAADINTNPALRAVEIPSANGVADARSIARLYSSFATGGQEIGLSSQTLDDLMAEPIVPTEGPYDLVLRTDTLFSLGFMKQGVGFEFASSNKAFGTPGAGGSFGFADPDAELGVAYIMNKMGHHLVNDPREKELRDAVYRSVAKLGPVAKDTPVALVG